MNDTVKIGAMLAGSAKAKERRVDLLSELGQAFDKSGAEAVTGEVVRRADAFADSFSERLDELKKQL